MNSKERHEARYQRRKAARAEKKKAAARDFGNFEAVFSFEHLYDAYRGSIKGVGWKASTQRYKASALSHISRTHDELLAGTFRSKGFYEFDIVERGKPRHIRSVHISERVVQRCLCDYCIVPMLSRSFIYDNGASLRGKGYDFAVKRVTGFLTDHYRKHGREGYALLFDFSKYFDTAQHAPVFSEIERSGIDDRLVSISEYFINNFGDSGLGLGSQISQIAALALPNRIDHYFKDVLRMKHYVRYMDDGCIISESKEKLRLCLRELRRLCGELGIRLNEKKTQIIKLSRGFTFVKVRFRFGRNGAIIRKASYKGIKHMRQKLRIFRRWLLRENGRGGRCRLAHVMARAHEKISLVPRGAGGYRVLRETIFVGGQAMEYFTYRRFKGKGIGGEFNIRYGTIVTERDGFIHAPDGRVICAATSENGWEHFRPNTPEGEYRQELLEKLYRFYEKNGGGEDFDPEKWPGAENLYWKNLLRTMTTENLTAFYKERLGEPSKRQEG